MSELDGLRWQHSHHFAADSSVAERRTCIVIVITIVTMALEIGGGLAFRSMALLADGWHMSTHVCAFLITALAYYFTRRHAGDTRYSFGTGKMTALGGFASAIVLLMVALLMAGESIRRLFAPVAIDFAEAIGIGLLALVVNGVSALVLNVHDHEHLDEQQPEQRKPHAPHHHDLNLRAAYLHVLADTFTTVVALIALLGGKFFGWLWLDPVVALLSSVPIFYWVRNLLRDAGGILLDRTPPDFSLPEEIRHALEADGDTVVTDLHVWQVATGKFAAVVALIARTPKTPEAYRDLLRDHRELVHVTVEVTANSRGDWSCESLG